MITFKRRNHSVKSTSFRVWNEYLGFVTLILRGGRTMKRRKSSHHWLLVIFAYVVQLYQVSCGLGFKHAPFLWFFSNFSRSFSDQLLCFDMFLLIRNHLFNQDFSAMKLFILDYHFIHEVYVFISFFKHLKSFYSSCGKFSISIFRKP